MTEQNVAVTEQQTKGHNAFACFCASHRQMEHNYHRHIRGQPLHLDRFHLQSPVIFNVCQFTGSDVSSHECEQQQNGQLMSDFRR